MAEASKVWTEGNAAIFLQVGGASPSNRVASCGPNDQLVAIDSIKKVGSEKAPIWNYDPTQEKEFIAVASEASPPSGFDSFNLMFRVPKMAIPRALVNDGKPFDAYINYGECVDLTDPTYGWTGFVKVLSGCEVAGDTEMSGKSFTGDTALEINQTCNAMGGIFEVGALILGSSTVAADVADITYGRRAGRCVSGNPETNDLYALLKVAGVNAAKVRYSVDGGKTWTDLAITGIGASEAVAAIAVVGEYLIVLSPQGASATASAYYVTTIDRDTGIPSSSWTKVTTGFVANALARDVTVLADGTVFLSAEDGYIYTTRDLLSGVQVSLQGSVTTSDFIRIDSRDTVIVAINALGEVYSTVNRGVIWAAPAAIPDAAGTVVTAIDDRTWLVGTSAGKLYYTSNRGKTWTKITFPNGDTGLIEDITVVNSNVMHVAHTAGGQGRIVTTWNGGATWTTTERRIYNLPSNDAVHRIAVPKKGPLTIRANHLAAACLNADGTTGTIIVGAATIQ